MPSLAKMDIDDTDYSIMDSIGSLLFVGKSIVLRSKFVAMIKRCPKIHQNI